MKKSAQLFLSHLCGGEYPEVGDVADYFFLSHLCGGES
ncbi:hypothetical protein [uncultured Gammaproteobacteria bacterium]|nr:hypothetical protein [uncultured Gammaproteobacteria bacterium]